MSSGINGLKFISSSSDKVKIVEINVGSNTKFKVKGNPHHILHPLQSINFTKLPDSSKDFKELSVMCNTRLDDHVSVDT